MSDVALSAAKITSAQIAELLASTLGAEKSAEVVDAAVARLGLVVLSNDLSLDNAIAILDELSRSPGMVGITARFARTRLDAPRSALFKPRPSADAMPPSSPGPISSRRDPGPVSQIRGNPPSPEPGPVSSVKMGTVTPDEIASLLASAMGAQQSQEVVRAAIADLSLPQDRLDKRQAMAVLDLLARRPGVVGLCARFGKARLLLRFAA